jgi:hypothetical protein
VDPVMRAARQGIPVVEINPDSTPISELANFRFAQPAGETLDEIMKGL